ncbi:MAG: hypothetical protein RLZZ450_4358 [Pseudomonadota bacterium]
MGVWFARASEGRLRLGSLALPCLLSALGVLAACGDEPKPAPKPPPEPVRASIEELQNPKMCQSCHPKHYEEWSSSMHAYAADDPVFIAMNKRGQRETNGQMGEFCVQCHAPMAFRNGLTSDGLNLADLPYEAKGVTCYFCHNATGAGPTEVNADVDLANDQNMRGNLANAVDPGVHGVLRSEAHSSISMKSALLCGSCHDVKNQKGAHIEQTLLEYRNSTSSIEKVGLMGGGDSCQGCHMKVVETDYVAQLPPSSMPMLKKRSRHSHRFAAVDVALTEFPHREAQKLETECALLNGAFIYLITTDRQGSFTVSIETNAGHNQPSGTSQDRRLWLEFIAYDANDKVLFQSGVIGDGELEEYPIDDPKHDGQLCMFRDKWQNESGEEVHMFWEAVTRDTKGSLVVPLAKDSFINHVVDCSYRMPGRQQPARVAMRMRMRPVGVDVMSSLVESGDLDPSVVEAMPTFTLYNTVTEWRAGDPDVMDQKTIRLAPEPITCP